MQSLQNPSNEVSHLLQELYNNSPEIQSSPSVFGNASPFNNNSPLQSNSFFGNAASNSIFGGGAQQQTAGAPNTFTFALPENKSIFGNVSGTQTASNSGSIFASSTFPSSNSSVNIFATAAQNLFPQSQNAFQSNAPSNNVFVTQNPSFFGAQQNSSSSNSIFGQNATTVVHNPFAQSFSNPQSPLVNQPTQFGAPPTIQSPFGTPVTNPPPYGAPTTTQSPFGAPTINPPPPYGPPPTNPTPFAPPVINPTPFAPPASNPPPFAAPLTNPSPFGAPTTTQPLFVSPVPTTNQSPFGNTFTPGRNPPAQENRSIFAQSSQTSSSIFGQTSSANTQYFKSDDPTVYSKLEQLTENEVKSYESSSFEFSKIPDKPPTLQMCSG